MKAANSGAYGLALPDLLSSEGLLVEGPASWPWNIVRRTGPGLSTA